MLLPQRHRPRHDGTPTANKSTLMPTLPRKHGIPEYLMKLLIAEDDAFFRKRLKQILEPEHDLLFANDGDEAWATLQKFDCPRLAILDWVMPGLSGPQVCRNVRACSRLSSMYLILFTARNSTADVISGFRAGADDYITKPFDPQELRLRIKLGKLALDLQDAAEFRSLVVEQRYALERGTLPELTAWPFNLKAAGDDHLNRAEDCIIGSLPGGTPVSSSSAFETSRTLPPEAARYFLEHLHA